MIITYTRGPGSRVGRKGGPGFGDLVRRQGDAFVAFARNLTDEEWERPSLCAGWTNKDVLAHLVLGLHLPLPRLMLTMARQRRTFDAANDLLSRDHASRNTARELIDEFDRARAHPGGIGRLLPAPLMLGDHAIHHLDIAFALGRSGVLSPRVTNAVLAVATRVPNPFIPAATRARGLTIRSTDTLWSRSSDRRLEVVGPGESIISVLAGRRHAIADLAGDGVVTLASRL
ncbi:maleylpyruvate isomerase family mycothiol-dependent enzyme [Micromonospora sp. NBC_01796]|uniref:maleylpyruvate isomerase family mycothiol-dependent enzyme n=1 Tax=Micromonospora sp. NBC_01796 TaxID=2975987 RepID=UPI002DDC071B|nr:maleylpyruvate isomerase family mycothiol-dependent enzyme [Micromonospora sp. NBC_01796]WSA83963.1 maleylpyruvate isomerase family mycothiol-dependent enzyme [Micromonospora sp. NBC_01796]